MGRSPCCDEVGLKKGPWTVDEDQKLVEYIQKNGHGSWRNLPKSAGLNRCGKSCRLRWTNYLRPNIKRGKFSDEEERFIIHLHSVLGNKWSTIANSLSGRTDNEIKNYWNTHLKKKLLLMGIDPVTHCRRTDLDLLGDLPKLLASTNFHNFGTTLGNQLGLQSGAAQLARLQILQCLAQIVTTSGPSHIFYPNNHFNDIILLSQQLGALVNNSITKAQNPIPSNSCPSYHQASLKPEKFSLMNTSCSNDGDANQMVNYYSMLASELTPSLASASSPEINVTENYHHNTQLVNLKDMPVDCSNSTGFKVWEVLDDSDTDCFWENILEKISRDG